MIGLEVDIVIDRGEDLLSEEEVSQKELEASAKDLGLLQYFASQRIDVRVRKSFKNAETRETSEIKVTIKRISSPLLSEKVTDSFINVAEGDTVL